MVIISKAIIREFAALYEDSGNSLYDWYEITNNSDWKNFSEMKRSVHSVDAVGNDRYVFNIRGNHYRLIAIIHFNIRTVYIIFIGTHQAYGRINASTITFKK